MGFRSLYLSWGASCEYSGPKDFTLPPLVACPLFCSPPHNPSLAPSPIACRLALPTRPFFHCFVTHFMPPCPPPPPVLRPLSRVCVSPITRRFSPYRFSVGLISTRALVMEGVLAAHALPATLPHASAHKGFIKERGRGDGGLAPYAPTLSCPPTALMGL